MQHARYAATILTQTADMRNPLYYFAMMMAVIYILTGIFFLIWGGNYSGSMPAWFHLVFGALLVLYGVFRLSRLRNSNPQ